MANEGNLPRQLQSHLTVPAQIFQALSPPFQNVAQSASHNQQGLCRQEPLTPLPSYHVFLLNSTLLGSCLWTPGYHARHSPACNTLPLSLFAWLSLFNLQISTWASLSILPVCCARSPPPPSEASLQLSVTSGLLSSRPLLWKLLGGRAGLSPSYVLSWGSDSVSATWGIVPAL